MRTTSKIGLAVVLGLLAGTALCASADPQGPSPAALERGQALVRAMSDRTAAANELTFATDELHVRLRKGVRTERSFSRRVAIRRPDAAWWEASGDREGSAWFADGKLTLVADRQKVWARVQLGATLDQAIDALAVRFRIPLPMADLLYSSPYDALFSAESSGGWVGEEEVGGQRCQHVAFRSEAVDWELWIREEGEPLPCKLRLVYTGEPGPPSSEIRFRDWNLAPALAPQRFAATIPDGYQRIGIVERLGDAELAAAGVAPPRTEVKP